MRSPPRWQASLPPRIDLLIYSPSSAAFVPVLATLLEPSPALSTLLAPQLHAELQRRQAAAEPLPKTYAELLAISARLVDTWDVVDQAAFLSAHPRIGETKNLSALSGVEQGGKSNDETPGEVLKRLSVRAFNSGAAGLGLADFCSWVGGRVFGSARLVLSAFPACPSFSGGCSL